MSFFHLQLYPSGANVPQKMHSQQFFTLIRVEPKSLTLFVTTQPCNLCANKIVTTGIRKVVFDAPYSMKESQDVLTDGGVEVIRFEGIKSSAYFKLYQS